MTPEQTDPTETPSLDVRGVHKGYEEAGATHAVLAGVDLRLERGERVAILGPSGSGKSTILNLIAGIDAPDAGEILVAGRPLTRMSERDRTLFRREHIGFVFQSYNLIPTLTVLENLLLPLELEGSLGLPGRARATELLAEVGLAERGGAFPDRLSGGEQQRVAVARALVHEPTLVLADEPTGNLDEEHGARIAGLLAEMTGRGGRTLLVVTHSRELAGLMDRTLRLTQGRLHPDPSVGARRLWQDA